MEQSKLLEREHALAHYISCIPKKIIDLHGHDNITEFVVHDLCCKHCFNLDRAAYFINNPDFNCIKGVAGFSRLEAYPDSSSIWKSPAAFSMHMQQAPFNKQVREIRQPSIGSSIAQFQQAGSLDALAQQLGFKEYLYYAWPMKHDNCGIFICTPCDQERALFQDCAQKYMYNGLSLLGFCPVH